MILFTRTEIDAFQSQAMETENAVALAILRKIKENELIATATVPVFKSPEVEPEPEHSEPE